MNSEVKKVGEDDIGEEKSVDPSETTADLQSDLEEPSTDNVGETSVEINVEDLIAEIEAESGSQSDPRGSSTRKRLDEILDEKRAARELEDFEDLEFS